LIYLLFFIIIIIIQLLKIFSMLTSAGFMVSA
jgi:hypothetical protein